MYHVISSNEVHSFETIDDAKDDLEDALQALGKDFKAKEVWKVFHEENKLQQV